MLLVLIGFGARAADDTPAAEAKPPAVKIVIHYLGKQYEEPVPLSLVDPILTDNGLQGARLAIQDNNKSGQFLGQEYDLIKEIVPADGALPPSQGDPERRPRHYHCRSRGERPARRR